MPYPTAFLVYLFLLRRHNSQKAVPAPRELSLVWPYQYDNPPKAKEIAMLQNSEGADVIFHAAGSSGSGLFDAAEEKKFLAIGVDSNQNGARPGFVLTSMVKSVDVAVFNVIRDAQLGQLKGGTTVSHGLKTGGVEIALDEYNRSLMTTAMLSKANSIKEAIISGSIKVPDYYLRKQ